MSHVCRAVDEVKRTDQYSREMTTSTELLGSVVGYPDKQMHEMHGRYSADRTRIEKHMRNHEEIAALKHYN